MADVSQQYRGAVRIYRRSEAVSCSTGIVRRFSSQVRALVLPNQELVEIFTSKASELVRD